MALLISQGSLVQRYSNPLFVIEPLTHYQLNVGCGVRLGENIIHAGFNALLSFFKGCSSGNRDDRLGKTMFS